MFTKHSFQALNAKTTSSMSSTTPSSSLNILTTETNILPEVHSISAAGITHQELDVVLDAISNACTDLGYHWKIHTNRTHHTEEAAAPSNLIGATGRVIRIEIRSDIDVDLEELQMASSAAIDPFVKINDGPLKQPILICVEKISKENDNEKNSMKNVLEDLTNIVQNEANTYDLCSPITENKEVVEFPFSLMPDSFQAVPTLHIEIDGAYVDDRWDTSSIYVFDELIHDDLRRRLLDVVQGYAPEQQNEWRSEQEYVKNPNRWNDAKYGPDPTRWVGGGLYDIPDDYHDTEMKHSEEEENNPNTCLGLTDEAIADLCCNYHPAFHEFERKLMTLFPSFHVCRLPEAVYGPTVSALTANAPTSRDRSSSSSPDGLYAWHIDADPVTTPPSPWTDIYGRYTNRSNNKPRFMSCLVYLNDEWNGKEYGAPTRFLDPPTGEVLDIIPHPGRVVLLDQDITHKVVPPEAAAGLLPRYSLVWKLVLHPKHKNQSSKNLWNDASYSPLWPKTTFFGSAKRKIVELNDAQ